MPGLDRGDRVITTTPFKDEAEMLQMSLAAAIVEVGAQADWCVYTKPFVLAGARTRSYAICVRRVFSTI
jgi:hypothetical protein